MVVVPVREDRRIDGCEIDAESCCIGEGISALVRIEEHDAPVRLYEKAQAVLGGASLVRGRVLDQCGDPRGRSIFRGCFYGSVQTDHRLSGNFGSRPARQGGTSSFR